MINLTIIVTGVTGKTGSVVDAEPLKIDYPVRNMACRRRRKGTS